MKPVVVGLYLLAVPAGAFAQPAAAPARADPADASAAVAPLVHRSPFARYRPFAAEVLGPWKPVNEEVGRIGGWRAYAREAYEASKQAAPAPDGTERPADTPHHGGHGAK